MLMGDLLTAVQEKIPIKIAVFNNGSLGFVELEMKAAGIVNFGTELVNPDFAAVAEAMGVFGRRVEHPGELNATIKKAIANRGKSSDRD